MEVRDCPIRRSEFHGLAGQCTLRAWDYIGGDARDRALLMPALVEDHVPADNPGAFIDAFIDDLD
jgi:hypothetical protein